MTEHTPVSEPTDDDILDLWSEVYGYAGTWQEAHPTLVANALAFARQVRTLNRPDPPTELVALVQAARRVCEYGPNERDREALRQAGKAYYETVPGEWQRIFNGLDPASQVPVHPHTGLPEPPEFISWYLDRIYPADRLECLEAFRSGSYHSVDAKKYRALHTPEVTDFLVATEREAIFQREKWGTSGDAGKTDTDWFWLIGYLAGKAIRPDSTPEKQLHHIITTAAACLNWHAARVGTYTTMRPGIAEPASGKLIADAEIASNGHG